MRAIAIDQYGGPGLLTMRDLPDPKVGPDSVLVRVRAAGVNPVDVGIRAGGLDAMFPVHFPLVPGWDVAGVVERVGAAVTEFAAGDEVIGYVRRDEVGEGTYAELVAAPVRTLARKPTSVSFTEAAALPLAGLTAWQALRTVNVGGGDTLLVNAAAGGVGSYAVQLAGILGATTVIGTASDANADFVRSLGGTPVAYGDGMAERVRAVAPDGVSAVVDFAGGESLQAAAGVLDQPGRLASIVDAEGVAALGGHYVFVRPDAADLTELARLVDAGQLMIHVTQRFPLADAAAAHEAMAKGHGHGKIVLEL